MSAVFMTVVQYCIFIVADTASVFDSMIYEGGFVCFVRSLFAQRPPRSSLSHLCGTDNMRVIDTGAPVYSVLCTLHSAPLVC